MEYGLRIVLQPAFILHHRSYRETSLILDLLTEEYGRVAVVARGVRQPHSKKRALFQPFQPLMVSYQGRGELMTLTQVESQSFSFILKKKNLFNGFYLNELLIRLLAKHDAYPGVYALYRSALMQLQEAVEPQKILRLFEKKLLAELGYALQLTQDIMEEKYYRFYPGEGLVVWEQDHHDSPATLFLGKHLLAFAEDQIEEDSVLQDAKRLMRLALSSLLGDKPLQSRKLFF